MDINKKIRYIFETFKHQINLNFKLDLALEEIKKEKVEIVVKFN